MEKLEEADELPERPIRLIRRERLKQLLEELGGPANLAAKAGTVDTHLTACRAGRRDVADTLANKLELGAGKPFGWMDSDPTLDAVQAGINQARIDTDLLATVSEILVSKNEVVRFTASALLLRLAHNPGEVVDIVGTLHALRVGGDVRAVQRPPDTQGRQPWHSESTTTHPAEGLSGESSPISLEKAAKGVKAKGGL